MGAIALMGHSWGTMLGVKVAQLHPDWFSAYVGISEFVDFEHSEGMGYQATLAAARADPNKQAVAELEAMAPFPDPRHPQRTLEHLEQERWLERYDGDTRTSLDNEVGQFRASDFGRVRD
jgi:proline iminopeptidase